MAKTTAGRRTAAGGRVDYLRVAAAAMPEAKLLAEIRRLVGDMAELQPGRWLLYHTHDSRRSEPGFPDLVICCPAGVLYRELKKMSGRVTPEQRRWLDALEARGVNVGVWRPDDWLTHRVHAELGLNSGLARPRKPA